MGNIKMSFYTNSKDDIDSLVTQEWDTLQNVWKNSEKAVYSLKKINVGVKKSNNYSQAIQQVSFEQKNGTIFLNIPSRICVSEIEQLDIKGRVISRTAVANEKSSIALSLNLKSSKGVNLIRLKMNDGNLTYKITSIK
jgi:predicted RND superfamily exporter protein